MPPCFRVAPGAVWEHETSETHHCRAGQVRWTALHSRDSCPRRRHFRDVSRRSDIGDLRYAQSRSNCWPALAANRLLGLEKLSRADGRKAEQALILITRFRKNQASLVNKINSIV